MVKDELKVMDYYKNSTRDQLVQIKDLKKNLVWYEIIRQDEHNRLTEFCCTKERFKNLYVKSK